jgi:hypothetical protein
MTISDVIFRTHVRDHGQPAVTPELVFGPKTVGGIHGSDDVRTSNRSEFWNRSKKSARSMFPAFGQHRLLGSFPQRTKLIQFVVEQFRSLPQSGFGHPVQPLVALCRLVHSTAGAFAFRGYGTVP